MESWIIKVFIESFLCMESWIREVLYRGFLCRIEKRLFIGFPYGKLDKRGSMYRTQRKRITHKQSHHNSQHFSQTKMCNQAVYGYAHPTTPTASPLRNIAVANDSQAVSQENREQKV